MKVKKFLDKKQYTEVEDLTLQAELYAYIVATHYNISLHDVYNMPLPIFQQSLKWALAVKDEKEAKLGEDEIKEHHDLPKKGV